MSRKGMDSFRFFIDTDGDRSTGSVDKDSMRVGYDFRFLMTTGTRFGKESQPHIRRLVARGWTIPDGERWYELSDQVIDWEAGTQDAPVAFDDDGIELAIPLELIGIQPGRTIQLAIHEDHLGSSPRSHAYEAMFSEKAYELK